jgi:ABC-type cobalt transport system substrate-binding protein
MLPQRVYRPRSGGSDAIMEWFTTCIGIGIIAFLIGIGFQAVLLRIRSPNLYKTIRK